MKKFRFRFEDSTEVERVYSSDTTTNIARQWFDFDIQAGWVPEANGEYTVEDMGEYTPPVEEQ